MALMYQHSLSPNPPLHWPIWNRSGAQPRSEDCTVIPSAGFVAHLAIHSAKQLQVCCTGRFLRALHFGKTSSTENMNLPLALIAPKFEQGEKTSYNINRAILLTAHTVPMWVAARFTSPSVHLIYFQKDLHMKNVLYLRATHRHSPSEQYLEHTMYLVYEKNIPPSILPPLEIIILSQLWRVPPTIHFTGATKRLCKDHLCICLTSGIRHLPCLGPDHNSLMNLCLYRHSWQLLIK